MVISISSLIPNWSIFPAFFLLSLVDRLDWFSLFPILNQLISLFGGCSPNTRKESKAEKQPGVDKSVELFSLGKVCSLRILVESYALLGPELLENAKKYAKQVSFCWPQLRVWLVVGRFWWLLWLSVEPMAESGSSVGLLTSASFVRSELSFRP